MTVVTVHGNWQHDVMMEGGGNWEEEDEMCEERADKRSDHAIVQVELSECSEWTPHLSYQMFT